MSTEAPQMDLIRTTFRLPQSLHKAIRLEAAESERDMTDIILEQLSLRYPELVVKHQDQKQLA